MGLKSRIKALTKPAPQPKVQQPKPEAKKCVPVGAFGTPFRVSPNPKYVGPAIAGYTFVMAWKVENTDHQISRFLEVSDRIKNVHKLYHGTPAKTIESICSSGLRPGRASCMFGSGIYLGQPPKAIGYASNGWRMTEACYLLEVEVALGNMKSCMAAEKHTMGILESQGYDSVGGFANVTASWGGKLRHNEYVVYNPDQVIVHRILEYQRSKEPTYASQPANNGPCVCIRDKGVVSETNTFASVLNYRECGSVAYTSVKVRMVVGSKLQRHHGSDKTVWVCKDCVDRLKLRIGSRIEAKVVAGWGKPSRVVYQIIE